MMDSHFEYQQVFVGTICHCFLFHDLSLTSIVRSLCLNLEVSSGPNGHGDPCWQFGWMAHGQNPLLQCCCVQSSLQHKDNVWAARTASKNSGTSFVAGPTISSCLAHLSIEMKGAKASVHHTHWSAWHNCSISTRRPECVLGGGYQP